MMLPVTTLLACGLAVILLSLSALVIRSRYLTGSSLGDDGDKTLIRRIRAQGNLTEYAPIFVVLIALAELQGGTTWIIGSVAALFFLGRLGHGYALGWSQHSPKARLYGTVATFTGLALGIIINLILLLF